MYFIEMFLEQWIMIAFQLKLLEWIIHKKMKFYKIFAASIFGSFSGCLILQLFDEDHGLKLGLMIISIVMTVKISCAFPMKKAWKYSVYLLVLSLFTGGIFTMIKSQIILPWLILAIASCMLVRYLYVSAVKDMNHDKESFYQVEFTILHKKLEVCAFLDTGNFLYEPVSQMPVCILEEETFLKYFHEPLFKMIEKQEAEGIRMIPYQSVGREHGMMPAVMANDMKITKEDRIIEHKKAVIAISKVSLSKWGAYEMLLHPDLIKNRAVGVRVVNCVGSLLLRGIRCVEGVANTLIGFQTLGVHFVKHRDMAVHIVVDKHIVLAGVVPVEPSGVLLHHTFPGNRGCQKQRIQSMVVKALTNELACRHQQHGFLRHNLCHLPYRRFPLLFGHFTCQKKRLLRRILQHFIEDRRLIRKSGQNHRRSSCLQCFFHICYNQAIAVFVPPQTLIGMGHRKLFLTEGQHRSTSLIF